MNLAIFIPLTICTAAFVTICLRSNNIRECIKSLRPHQWLKNLLVFLPVIAAHKFSPSIVYNLGMAFISFSLCASAAYLFNDLLDIRHDQTHPTKSLRPLASGKIRTWHAVGMAASLLAIAFLIASMISIAFMSVLAAYLLLTLSYSLKLKRLMMIDVVALACLYTLRVLAGGVAAETEVSFWMMGFCIFLFFCLALIKRMTEILVRQKQGYESLTGRDYSVNDLGMIEMLAAGSGLISVLVLALYIENPAVQLLYLHPEYLWFACLILLYWVGRILLLSRRGLMHDDPIIFAARDPISLAAAAMTFVVMWAGS